MKERDPLRIFHFIYDHIGNPWVGGGAAQRANEIYRRLAERHEITIVCGKYPGSRDYREGNVKFHFVGTERDNYVLSTFCYAVRAAAFLERNRDVPDIVVEDFAPYNPILSFIRRKDAVIQVHQREGFHLLRKYLVLGTPFYLIEKFYPRLFGRAIVISERSRDKFALGHNAAVISNGFDADYLSVEGREEDYVLFLGRMEIDSKGLDILLEAFDYLDGVTLKIVGKGKDEKKVKRMLSDYQREKKVRMVGFVEGENKLNCLKNCTFIVVPSRFEVQGIVVLEAAAMGKPVIVSDIPELGYAVEAGFGLSFPRDDARDLARRIKYLMENKQVRREMGLKAREFAKNYTWDSIATKYEQFLLESAAGSAGEN